MAAPEEAAEMPFILTDAKGKTNPSKRKLIRTHVMLGRNRGKTRKAKPTKTVHSYGSEGLEDRDGTSNLLIKLSHSIVPNKVGSELSFTQFAAAVEPQLVHDVLRFYFIAKKVMYPLESYFIFHKTTKVDTSWFELLTSDAAYMHAAVFAIQAYSFAIASTRETHEASKRALSHQYAALRLLRERLYCPDPKDKFSDATILVVLYLALHAYFMNEYDTSQHHMSGLRKLVDIRGGLTAFSYNTKLIIELLKCDLGIALHNGSRPMFFDDPASEPLMLYDLASLAADEPEPLPNKRRWDQFRMDLSSGLAEAWAFMKRFCSTINSAAEHKRRLPKETLLNAMASVMYRLLHMSFDNTSVDEGIRLGLLIFSAHIFLNFRGIRQPHKYLPDTYKNCLMHLELPGTLPPQILPWLLVIGSLSTFTSADDVWLIPWMRVNITLCETCNWNELRGLLKSCPWIDTLHDQPGQEIFDKAILSQTDNISAG